MVKGEHDFLNFRKTSDFWKFSEQGFPEMQNWKLCHLTKHTECQRTKEKVRLYTSFWRIICLKEYGISQTRL